MERNFTPTGQNRTKTAAESGKFFLAHNPDNGQETEALVPFQLTEISRLSKLLRSSDYKPSTLNNLSEPLSLDQVEMLEAELRNQGILPAISRACTLSQRVLHEASVIRWKARRHGLPDHTIRFLVDIPRYLVGRAHYLTDKILDSQANRPHRDNSSLLRGSNPWLSIGETEETLEEELLYLECFAAYLCGMFEETNSRYHRGLNVVLRALIRSNPEKNIAKPSTEKTFTAPAKQAIALCLPLSQQEVQRRLRELRARP